MLSLIYADSDICLVGEAIILACVVILAINCIAFEPFVALFARVEHYYIFASVEILNYVLHICPLYANVNLIDADGFVNAL